MKALDPINLSIEFVKQTVDPGGGGEIVNPAAQTGDFAIWAILAIMFVGIIAFCSFRLSRSYNRKVAYATNEAKHAKIPGLRANFNYTKALLGIAIVGLVASLSITTTNAIAKTQKNEVGFQPDKLQVLINEETGEATCDPFNFVNNTDNTYLFEKSELSLSEDAKLVSTAHDWDLTLNASGLNADLFSGQPGMYKIPLQNIQSMYPGQSSPATLKFNKIDTEIAKKLIGKQVFNLSLTPYLNLVDIPTAVEGLEYNGELQVGVAEAEEYTLKDNEATDAGNYTATATLKEGFIWADKTSTPKQIVWSIDRANISVNIEGQNKTYTFDKDKTYEFPKYDEGELAYIATSTSKFFNAENISPKPNGINPVSRYNAGTEYLNLKPELFTYNDKNVEVKTWNVTDGYLQIDRKPIAVPVAEENLIYTSDKENPLVGVKDGEGYILTDNTGVDARDYTAIASLDSNYIWDNGSTEPASIIWTIQKAVLEEVRIMGNSKDYAYDGKPHTFPQYPEETSYFIQGFEMAEGHPRSAFDASLIYPPNNTEVIAPRTETKVGTYGLGLSEKDWNLSADPNVDSSHCKWTVLKDGFLQINEASLVTMNITADKSSVEIGNEITFTISLQNNTKNELSGGYLYDYYDEIKHDINIPANDTVTITHKRTVDADDFIYSAMYDIWTFEIPTMDPYYSIYKITTTQLEYIQTDVPVISDIIFDNKEHSPFADVKYKNVEIKTGDASGTNADTYNTIVAPKPGYCWPDGTRADKQIKWYIKPYTVNLEFDVTDHYTVQYGDAWPAQEGDVQIVSKQEDLPKPLEAIFPDGLTYLSFYSQGMGAGTKLPVIINDASHNDNYKVVKKSTTIEVEQRALTLTWDQGSLNPEYDGNEHWPNYGLATPYLEEKPIVNLTAVNSSGQSVLHPTDTGTYTITANNIVQDVTGKNYRLVLPEGKAPTCTMTIQQSAEAYPKAVLTSKTFRDPETLWFFYDDKNYTPDSYIKKVYNVTNTSYQAGTNAVVPEWYGDDECKPEEIVITEDFKNCTKIKSGDDLTSLDLWFAGMQNVKSITGLENINLSVIKTINGLFKGFDSQSLTNFDLSSCDFSKITSAISMFEEAKFSSIKLPKCEWNGVNTSSMFKNCSELTDLNSGNLTLTEIVNAQSMFEGCSKLTDIFICDWTLNANVSKNLENMFFACSSLSYIACSSFDVDWSLGFTGTSKYMFKDCTSLPNYSNIPTTSEYDITYAKASESSSDQALFKSINGRWVVEDDTLKFFTDVDELAESAPADQLVPINAQTEDDVPWTESAQIAIRFSSSESFNKWSSSLKSTAYWFQKFGWSAHLTGPILLSCKFNTSNVTNMKCMFDRCKVEDMDLSSFDTSNVVDMTCMFANCPNLEKPDLKSFNTSKVTNMYGMFVNCSSLYNLDIKTFNTSNVLNMGYMFAYCESLTNLDLSSFDTSNVVDMTGMFAYCMNLKELNLKSFDTSKVTNMSHMFDMNFFDTTFQISKLESVDLSSFNTSKVTDMSSMFLNCNNLKNIDTSKFDTSSVLNMNSMFSCCESLESLNVSSFNTTKVSDMSSMFYRCPKLQSLDVRNFSTANVTNMAKMFMNCETLTSLDVSKFNTSNVIDMSDMFRECKKIEQLDVSKFDTSNVIYMKFLFANCESLSSINVGNFDTRKVIDMKYMFNECFSLTELDLTSFNLQSCNNTDYMFSWCHELEHIYCDKDVDWSTYGVTSSYCMFEECYSLDNWEALKEDDSINNAKVTNTDKGIVGFFTYKKYYGVAVYHDDTKTLEFTRVNELPDPLPSNIVKVPENWVWAESPFNQFAEKVKNVYASTLFYEWMHNNVIGTEFWFANFENLETIQLDNFNFSKVINLRDLFSNCRSIKVIDISSVDISTPTSQLRTTVEMFSQCINLEHIYCKYNEDISIRDFFSTTDMFDGCTRLHNYPKDGQVDKTYAYMDRMTSEGVSNKGIFENKDAIATEVGDTLKFMTSYETTGDEELFTVVPTNWKDFNNPPFTNLHRAFILKINSTDAFNKWFVNVKSTRSFFKNFGELLDANCIRFWDTSNVTDMSHMFEDCTNLKELHLGSYNTDSVNNFSYMFYNVSSLEHIYCTPSTDWNKPAVIYSDEMFMGSKLHNIHKVDKNDVTYARTDKSAAGGPIGLFEAEDPDPGVAEYTPNTTSNDDEETGTLTFKRLSQLSSPDADYVYVPIDLTPVQVESPFVTYKNKVTDVTATPEYKDWSKNVISFERWFYEFKILNNVDINNFSTCNVLDTFLMFGSCENLENIDISSFDISNLFDTSSMFKNCLNLQLILCNDGCDWKKSTKLFHSDNMFDGCEMLPHYYDVGDFDKTYAREDKFAEGGDIGFFTNKKNALVAEYVKDQTTSNPDEETGTLEFKTYEELSDPATADWMYVPYNNILDASKIISPFSEYKDKVTKISCTESFNNRSLLIQSTNCWFAEFNKCTYFDFGSFHTSNISRMNNMFDGCSSLVEIDISSWDVSSLMNSVYMFSGCKSLEKIYCKPGTNWTLEMVSGGNTWGMFDECESLPNWETIGTVTDITYAKADHGEFDPGFFTEKPDYEDFGIAEYVKTSGEAEPETGRLEFKMYSEFVSNSGTNWVYVPTDWSNVDSPYLAFADKVTDISSTADFKSWMSNVTSTKAWFKHFNNLTQVDISNWDTSNVRDMSTMFVDCGVEWVDISNLNIDKLINTAGMFVNCYYLDYIFCSPNTDWSKSESLSNSTDMFGYCGLPQLHSGEYLVEDKSFAREDKSGVGGEIGLFTLRENVLVAEYINDPETSFEAEETGTLVLKTSKELTEVNPDFVYVPFNSWDNSPFEKYSTKTTKVEATEEYKKNSGWIFGTNYWFSGFNKCILILTENFNTEHVNNMIYMFSGCSSLRTLDLTSFNTANVKNMNSMFYSCSLLTTLDLSSFNVGSLRDTASMFEGCTFLSTIYCQPWADWKSQSLVSSDEGTSTDMFKDCSSLPNWQELGTTTDITYAKVNKNSDKGFFTIKEGPDTGVASYNEINQTLTFKMYSNLTTEEKDWVPVPTNWSIDEESPFKKFSKNSRNIIFSEDFKNWSPNVKSTIAWFSGFNLIESIDLTNFNFNNVIDMRNMFFSCNYLKSSNFSGVSTNSLRSTANMFWNCSSLEYLDLSSFNTSNVWDMEAMFRDCPLLQTVDISSFDVSKLQQSFFMFSGCVILSNILVEPGTNWNNDAPNLFYSFEMFSECEKLPHWKELGPIAIDVTFAKANEPNSPGFFTAKGEMQTTNTNDANDGALTNSELTEQEEIVEPEPEVVIDEPTDPQASDEPDSPVIETDENKEVINLLNFYQAFESLNKMLFM